MKKSLFIIGLIMKMVFIKSSCYASDSSCKNDSTIIADTVRVVYYLDGKQVPYSTIREKGQKGELGEGIGAGDPKKAIRHMYDFSINNRDNLLGINTFMRNMSLIDFDNNTQFNELCDIFDKERKSERVMAYCLIKRG